MFTFRKSAALVLTTVIAASTLMSASAASTTKNLSSNFTLVNLFAGDNNGTISYLKSVESGGGVWRDPQSFTLNGVGDQAIYRQYDDNDLDPGSGSVVVSTDGPVGAVVQIQARNGQIPTSGSYIGVSEGAPSANVPLVSRRGSSLSGLTNSQIIIQNASSNAINVEVKLIDSTTGNTSHTKTFTGIASNASVEYDLDTEAALPEGWFGSASVTAVGGGEVAVVSNFFTGLNAMQTFNAFTKTGTKWFAPLFTSRLANGLSTPIAVQNVSGGDIPIGGVTLTCTKNANAPGDATITRSNTAVIKNTASVFFNPAPTDSGYPAEWYGSCIVNTGAFQTAMFVQMRFVGGDRAGAYEGILGTGSNQRVIIPLYAKRLANSFASAVTIQNLNEGAAANVTLEYKGGEGTAAACTQTFSNVSIPAGGSYIQNHRIPDGPNSVPQIPDGCFGTLTVTGNQALDAFVQLDFTTQGGDAFMAHGAFTVVP